MSSVAQLRLDIQQSQVFNPDQKRFILMHLDGLTEGQTAELQRILAEEKEGIRNIAGQHQKESAFLLNQYWPKIERKIQAAHRQIGIKSEAVENKNNQQEIAAIEKILDH